MYDYKMVNSFTLEYIEKYKEASICKETCIIIEEIFEEFARTNCKSNLMNGCKEWGHGRNDIIERVMYLKFCKLILNLKVFP